MQSSSRLSLMALAFLVTSSPWPLALAADPSSQALPASPGLSIQPVRPLVDATDPILYEADRKIIGGGTPRGARVARRQAQAAPGLRRKLLPRRRHSDLESAPSQLSSANPR